MREPTRLFLALTAALTLAAGCAGVPRPAPDPAAQWAERVGERITAAEARPSHPVRYNPAPCDCPPFEVQLEGVWHRVAFSDVGPDAPAVVALEEARLADPAGVWEVQGRVASALATCGRGALVVSLALAAFGRPAED